LLSSAFFHVLALNLMFLRVFFTFHSKTSCFSAFNCVLARNLLFWRVLDVLTLIIFLQPFKVTGQNLPFWREIWCFGAFFADLGLSYMLSTAFSLFKTKFDVLTRFFTFKATFSNLTHFYTFYCKIMYFPNYLM